MHILAKVTSQLVTDLAPLRFREPVAIVYNPLEYARAPYDAYVVRYGRHPEIILLGMNPGPFGMAQTGVPFGDVEMVRDWLGIEAEVTMPSPLHPKRPVLGFQCPRGEVSGRRLWGWARDRFQSPDRFFDRFFVANYCPLVFMEESGRNRTPDKLFKDEQATLFSICDQGLVGMVQAMAPRRVIGVGRFAASRAKEALADFPVEVGMISHPSPANPKANRGWAALVEKELADLAIHL
ncbi:MAG: single-stranded DNA-binding protein [Proteobacteria bacterium]|nr:single-stranded DNA-binding protein [Pseudomonadota bacterium]MBU1688180.1 single-stranded DNA-binding protein [Pseudomonadota bacterium]